MEDLLCVLDCVDEIPQRYDAGQCAPVFRKFGFQGFIAFKCGVSFTDIKSVPEWEAKIAAGDIIVSPAFGNFSLGTSNTSTVQGGCGETYPEFTETPFTFTTPSTKEDYADEDWWYAFKRSANGYTLGYMNCEGRLYLNDATVSAYKASTSGALAISNPGFAISLTSAPQWVQGPNGIGKAGIWTVGGNIIENDVHRSIEIPGVYEVLKAA